MEESEFFYVGHVEYDVLSTFSAIFLPPKDKNTHFPSKMARPPVIYDVISLNHSN